MSRETLTVPDLMLRLKDVEYIDVVHISEPETNMLRLVVEQMTLNTASASRCDVPVEGAVPIEHQKSDLRFEVVWERYDVYTVLNESYDSGIGVAEAWEGKLFRKYSESRYLTFINEAYKNIAFLDPGYRHWAIIAENHHVHVISSWEPEIRVLDAK